MAFNVLQAMKNAYDSGDHQGMEKVVLVVVLEETPERPPAVSSVPSDWKFSLDRLKNYPDVGLPDGGPGMSAVERYESACGPCNLMLQLRLRELLARHPKGCRPRYREKNMSVNQSYRIKVSNRNDRPERIHDVNEKVRQAMEGAGLVFQNAGQEMRLPFPEGELDYEPWVEKVVDSIEAVMDQLTRTPEIDLEDPEGS